MKDEQIYNEKIGKFYYMIIFKRLESRGVKYTRHTAGLKAFGRKLREIRKSKALSQEQLAWKADLELSQISRIERGVIGAGLSQVFTIAAALEISVKDLFDFELPEAEPED
jgi:DNA-binding XRE family transcriptional regulator